MNHIAYYKLLNAWNYLLFQSIYGSDYDDVEGYKANKDARRILANVRLQFAHKLPERDLEFLRSESDLKYSM